MNDVKPTSPIVQSIIDQLLIHCDNSQVGCRSVVPLEQVKLHVAGCHPPFNVGDPSPPRMLAQGSSSDAPPPLTPSKIAAILAQPMDKPRSEPEERCTVRLIKRHLGFKESEDIELRTGGQVLSILVSSLE